ncbi:MAG TPA: hypothetical protein VFE44_08375 [Thermoanaerobaculia bacterium]|nr:hypothetical protein [Thermoanaerobaculia bacterium]
MRTSAYQLFKIHFLSFVPLAKDAVHIYIGFACLLLALLVLRRPLRSFWILVPGIAVSIVMELLDLRDDQAWLGRLRFSASLKDIFNTNAIPLVLVLLARWRLIKS